LTWPRGAPRASLAAPVKSAVVIRHLFISPGHNFFGRHGLPAGTHPTHDVRSVRCCAGLGLEGDRFFGYRPGYNGQVTFFSWETFEAARREFRRPDLPPDVFRRNVVVAGVHLNELAGTRFSLGAALFRPAWRFFRAYVLKRGFLDGFPGFYIAVATAFGAFVRYSRLYETDAAPTPPAAGERR